MSNIILYTTDEHSANGIREASFQEVLDAARLALAKRVRRGTGFTSPRVTADFLRVRLGSLKHGVFCLIYLTLCGARFNVNETQGTEQLRFLPSVVVNITDRRFAAWASPKPYLLLGFAPFGGRRPQLR